MQCDSCQSATINGVFCHEVGCPKALHLLYCKVCGEKFLQSRQDQYLCEECYADELAMEE